MDINLTDQVIIREVTHANWRAALGLRVAPEQQRFIAGYAPIAAIGLAKAYIRPGDLIWTPFAFYAPASPASPTSSTSPEAAMRSADSQMVGFAMLAYASEQASEASLYHFFIDQRSQGRGYGAQALRALIALTRERLPKCGALRLTVHPENARAQRLYLRAGFVATGRLLDGEPEFTHNIR